MICTQAHIHTLCRRIGALVLALAGGALFAGPFTAGNLVVYRVGEGSAALTNAATAVFVDEYTPAGNLVQSIAMPTAVPALTAQGTATAEGMLTLATTGNHLFLTGYNCATGTATPSTTGTVPRMVARIAGDGSIDVSTSLTDAFVNISFRSIASDGTGIWLGGSADGVRYTTLGSSSSISISTTIAGNRSLVIANGQLYSGSTTAPRIYAVGNGLPTTAGQTMTGFTFAVATPGPSGPYAFFLCDLDNGTAGNDTLYVADNGANAIKKYCFTGTEWTQRGANVALTGCQGLTGKVNGGTVQLYATTSSKLISLADTTGFNGALVATTTDLVTAATNTAFRGVAFAPTSPTVISLSAFEARAQADRVELAWRTGSEFEHAGFHVHRGASSQGSFTRLTGSLIPAKGTAQGGAEYVWMDSAVTPGETWFYKLEDVDTHGVSTFHGPVSATVGPTSGIFAFTATPPSIFLGGGSWLAWATQGQVTLNGEAVSGTTQWVAPKATTGYTLADANGATRLVTVAVRPFAVRDMVGLARAWGSSKGEAAYDLAFDLNGDGKVDDADVALCLK